MTNALKKMRQKDVKRPVPTLSLGYAKDLVDASIAGDCFFFPHIQKIIEMFLSETKVVYLGPFYCIHVDNCISFHVVTDNNCCYCKFWEELAVEEQGHVDCTSLEDDLVERWVEQKAPLELLVAVYYSSWHFCGPVPLPIAAMTIVANVYCTAGAGPSKEDQQVEYGRSFDSLAVATGTPGKD